MKKKMLFVMAMIAAFVLFVPSVMAATTEVSSDLAGAVSSAADGDTLKLTADITVDSAIIIDKELTIDLNNHKITIDDSVSNDCIQVKDGNLTVTGTGTIEEKVPYYGAIWVYGSTNKADTDYSTLVVDKNVTLKGYSGVLVRQTADGSGGNRAYGVTVTVKGTIVAVTDGAATGTGIQVSGNIQPKAGEAKDFTNYPAINVDGANITSDGVGIYAAGYATWNIKNATISGVESAIAVKSGILNIDGGKYTGTGPDKRPTEGFNNGVNPSGAALQVESNTGYAGNVEINITDGTFESKNSVAVYEYVVSDKTPTSVNDVTIEGGTFISAENLPVLDLSEKFTEEHTETEYITGGTFKSGTEEAIVETLFGEYLPVEDTVVLTAYLMIDGKVDETDKTYIEKGTVLGKEFETEFVKVMKKDLKEENKYLFEGIYSDKALKTKFDFTKELTKDAAMYVNVETNPETGDVNLVAIVLTILVGLAGAFVVLRRRFAKSN